MHACLGGVSALCVHQVLPPIHRQPPEPDRPTNSRGSTEGLWSIGRFLTTNYSNNIHHNSDYNSTRSSSPLSSSKVTSHQLASKMLAPKLLSEVLVPSTLSPFQQKSYISLSNPLHNSNVSINKDRNLPRYIRCIDCSRPTFSIIYTSGLYYQLSKLSCCMTTYESEKCLTLI